VSALAGTIFSPWSASRGPSAAWWLRSLVSLLAAVGILAIALPVAFGSGSRGAGVDPVQVFSSGPLIAAETSGGGQLSIDGIVPGQSRSATIRLANAGSEAAAFSLAAQIADRIGPGGASLSGAMTLRVRPVDGGPPLYAGPLAAFGHIDLGRVPAGGKRAYRFTVALSSSAGNEIAGSSSRATFALNGA